MQQEFITIAKKVLQIEGEAILNTISQLESHNFNQICAAILQCEGKVIVTGMGKSGHIAKKIAATMASTGTPAFFMHPAEACHGDLGMITPKDLVIIFSNSGETEELITIMPGLKRVGVKIISITSNSNSKIAKYSDWCILLPITLEACPLNLAPTTSTTCALALGDALAISLLTAKKFSPHDFAKYHPSGRLGKRLSLRVEDIMHTGQEIPLVDEGSSLINAIVEMSRKCFGLLLVTTNNNPDSSPQIVGVLSDGDLRRILNPNFNIHATKLTEVINRQFKSINPAELAIEAVTIMESNRIFSLPVVKDQIVVGIFNMHDLLKAGIL